MQPDLPVADLAAEITSGITSRAKQLGLAWSMRKATVTEGSDPANVLAVFDGDSVPIGMISQIGALAVGQRVWVTVVPSGGDGIPGGGNYISGHLGSTGIYRDTVELTAAATSISFTDIPSGLAVLDFIYTSRFGAGGVDNMRVTVDNDVTAASYRSTGYNNSLTAYATPFVVAAASWIGGVVEGNNNASEFGGGRFTITNWNAAHTANGYINFVALSGTYVNGVAAIHRTCFGNHTGIRPYSSVQFFPESGFAFQIGTRFELIGYY